MKTKAEVYVLLYGHDRNSMAGRQRVLETYGYRVVPVTHVSDLMRVPAHPRMDLLVLTECLTANEAFAITAQAGVRWPGIKKLSLEQIPPELRDPTQIMLMVKKLVGVSASTVHSHVY